MSGLGVSALQRLCDKEAERFLPQRRRRAEAPSCGFAARITAALLLPLAFGACVTGKKTGEAPRVPAVLDSAFRPCVPGDGAATIQVFDGGQIVGAGEAEWVADDKGSWEIQITNAVGSLVLSLKRQGHQVVATGPVAHRIPSLKVDDDGFLEADGHRIAVRAHEVPCFLAYALPRSWTSKVADVESGGEETVITLADDDRGIVVTAHGVKSSKHESLCADISWSRWLVFRNTLTWCTTSGKDAELSGVEGYTIKWVRIDEERSS